MLSQWKQLTNLALAAQIIVWNGPKISPKEAADILKPNEYQAPKNYDGPKSYVIPYYGELWQDSYARQGLYSYFHAYRYQRNIGRERMVYRRFSSFSRSLLLNKRNRRLSFNDIFCP